MCLLPMIGLPLSHDLTSQLQGGQLGSRHHGHLAGCGVSCWHGGEFALFNLPAAYLQRQGERVQVWQLAGNQIHKSKFRPARARPTPTAHKTNTRVSVAWKPSKGGKVTGSITF